MTNQPDLPETGEEKTLNDLDQVQKDILFEAMTRCKMPPNEFSPTVENKTE